MLRVTQEETQDLSFEKEIQTRFTVLFGHIHTIQYTTCEENKDVTLKQNKN